MHIFRDSVDNLYILLHTECNKIFLKSQGYGEVHRFPLNSLYILYDCIQAVTVTSFEHYIILSKAIPVTGLGDL
jgi:hypothetical protein